MLTDLTWCGDESAQCIERDKMCDDVIDCVNGWDERRETCPDNDFNSGMYEIFSRCSGECLLGTRMTLNYALLNQLYYERTSTRICQFVAIIKY